MLTYRLSPRHEKNFARPFCFYGKGEMFLAHHSIRYTLSAVPAAHFALRYFLHLMPEYLSWYSDLQTTG